VGDGASVLEDIISFRAFGVEHDAMLINHAHLIYEAKEWPYQHFIAGDSHMNEMQEIANRMPEGVLRHCWNPGSGEENGFHIRWLKQDGRGWNGTTANLGTKIGIALDYLRIVLAGIPMDESGHWYDKWLKPEDKKLKPRHSDHLWFWTEVATRPVGHFIRSMSGNTKDLLGEPTYEWLTEVLNNEG
jgi:hypothetical protein